MVGYRQLQRLVVRTSDVMTDDRNRFDDKPPDDEKPGSSGRPDDAAEDQHHSIEDEIEEILREKGEAPGRTYRPSPRRVPSLPPMSPVLTEIGKGLLLLAFGAVLMFVAFRVMGPAGFRLGAMGLLMFLAFYAMQPVIMEFLRRRKR